MEDVEPVGRISMFVGNECRNDEKHLEGFK